MVPTLTLATTGLPEWTAFLIAVATVIAAIASVFAAVHSKQGRDESRPPSNGVSLGQLAEGIAQVQHYLTNLSSGTTDIPSATSVARALAAGTPVPEPTQVAERRDPAGTG